MIGEIYNSPARVLYKLFANKIINNFKFIKILVIDKFNHFHTLCMESILQSLDTEHESISVDIRLLNDLNNLLSNPTTSIDKVSLFYSWDFKDLTF